MSSTDGNPNSILDFLLLALALALLIPFLVANGVVYRSRKRKYFQATGGELILGTSVAGIICIGSAFIVNQHFRRDHFKFFSFCALWTYWFQLILGLCLWLCFIALRLHHLFIFCTTGKPLSILRVWAIYLPVMMAPAIIFGIIATVMRVSRHPCGFEGRCVIESRSWKLTSFFLLPTLYFSVIIFLLYRLRKQKDYLLRTQCQHTKDYAMMAFVIYLLTGNTYWSGRQDKLEIRLFLTFNVFSVVFVYFWIHTGWPVYLCLFKRADEMDKYEESLGRHGATCLRRYPYLPGLDADGNVIPRTFALDEEDAIFHAIAAEQSKKDALKTKKDHLQRRLTRMRAQIQELKHQKTVAVPPRASQSLPPVRSSVTVLPDLGPISRHLSLQL